MVSQAVTFWLSESDRDLIDWLDALPKGQRSQSIRTVLRAGIKVQKEQNRQAGIQNALEQILDKLDQLDSPAIVSVSEDEGQNAFVLDVLGGLGK